ncbi:MAG: hydantoinase/oxoprolinase family protein [Chloroflexi bacterium]|nr:hydantoinase/oxoprolinase family protein [Chloroflexota bacterium]
MPRSTYRIGVDIGGTFTDCVVVDGAGRLAAMAKSATTPGDQSLGVIEALSLAAQCLGMALPDLLAHIGGLVHGCTVATNALLERKGARAALVTTRGFEDTIFIGRVMQKRAGLSPQEIAHQSRLHKAEPPVVPLALIRGISERIDAEGDVLCPLNEDEVRRALAELIDEQGAEAVAICFLWSFLRPEHERRIQEMLSVQYPDVYVSASHEVAPVLGEYERTVSTVLTAYLGPRVSSYLHGLEWRLQDEGLSRELLMMTCRGGLTSVADASQHPLLTLDSGPVGGAIGGKLFSRTYGLDKVICADMGGTSFDVSLVMDGDTPLETLPIVDQYSFYCPKVAVHSIGAGGGSIVSVDVTGMPKVGPESAGACPGPACYDAGGTEPTVTDVDLVLGYINPDYFLGGRQTLSRARAEESLTRVAAGLGMDCRELAVGAFTIVNARMADMVNKLTIESGHDPREFALLAYGGASGTHLPFLAQELGVKAVYLPEASSVFSALGMVRGDIIHTVEHSFLAILPLADKDAAAIVTLFGELEGRVLAQFQSEGWPREQVKLTRYLNMKYRLQVHELAIPVGDLGNPDMSGLAQDFEGRYEQVYGTGTGYRQVGIEVVKLRVDGMASPPSPPLAEAAHRPQPDPSPALKGTREAYFPSLGRFVPVKTYDGGRLRYGNVLEGPCIVERMGDTIVLPPGVRGYVDEYGTVRLEV